MIKIKIWLDNQKTSPITDQCHDARGTPFLIVCPYQGAVSVGNLLETVSGFCFRFQTKNRTNVTVIFGTVNFRVRPRVCENLKFENPSGNLLPIFYILRLNNGF